MREIAKSSLLLVSDVPDNCGANLRYKKWACQSLGADVLYDEMAGCTAHKVHTYTTKALAEEQLVGHVHATQTVMGITARQAHLEGAFVHLVNHELEVIPGPPPTEHAEILETVLDNTLLRSREIVRSRSTQDPVAHKVLAQSVLPLKRMAHGKISFACCQHYENGCCLDSDGKFCRAIYV